MTTHISDFDNEDIELLSAYLDDALPDAERTRLEKRLAEDPALQQTLNELQVTVHLLQDLPPVTPPRSFTIDPATVQTGSMEWLRIASWLRLGSALTAIVFALTLTLEFGFLGSAPTASQEALDGAAAPELALEEAPAEIAPGTAREVEPQTGSTDMADADDAVPASEEADGSIMEQEGSMEEEASEAGEATARDNFQNGAEEESAQDDLVAPLDLQPESGEMLSAPPQIQAPSVGEEESVVEGADVVQQPTGARETPATDEPIAPLRVVQMVLVVLALGLATGSWWMVRRSHQ
ncbi:MAG: hypothetical protein AAGF95_26235 [Chloroflexota bacterium]